MIKAFLVDDERPALANMACILERIGGVQIVGSSINPVEAIESIRDTRPDVVFLDIKMPVMSGMELAEIIRREHLADHIVFVTAYGHYALHAFEQETLDYVLKPIDYRRLEKTVQRLRHFTLNIERASL